MSEQGILWAIQDFALPLASQHPFKQYILWYHKLWYNSSWARGISAK